MFRHTTALLPLLTGCHVFASGDILLTCDDLADCGAINPTDSGGEDFVELSVGIALSISDDESWLAGTFAPPDLSPDYQRGGPGSTAGAVLWSADRSRLFLTDHETLFILGSEPDDVKKVEIPTSEDILDIALNDSGLYLITSNWLFEQVAPSAALTTLSSPILGLDFAAITTTDTELFMVTDNGASPDLYSLDTNSGNVNLLAEDFDTNSGRVAGDIFIGPSGELMGCSPVGAIVSIDEMTAGTSPEVYAFVSTTIDDVLACGYDSSIDHYLVISASQGLFITALGEDDIQLPLLSEGQMLSGASIY